MQSNNGFIFIVTQTFIKIGKNTEAVEVFEQNPVMNEIIKDIMSGIRLRGRLPIKPAIFLPNKTERPVAWQASASANPAPSKIITSQATPPKQI